MCREHEWGNPAAKANFSIGRLDRLTSGRHHWPMNFFVTGTDTGVGKTYVTRLMLEALREQGTDAVGYKPVACGDREDATLLAAASGGIAVEEVNPVFFKTPVAPYVAGLLENKDVHPADLLAGYRLLADRHAQVIVEGVGGWEVPLAPNYRVADLAADLGLPVIVVAGNRLGAINHILLTVGAIQARGLQCAGIILNQLGDELDTAMITNKGVVEDLTGVPLLDHLIHGQDFLSEDALRALGTKPTTC
jgi:dethiobiotin synthetase